MRSACSSAMYCSFFVLAVMFAEMVAGASVQHEIHPVQSLNVAIFDSWPPKKYYFRQEGSGVVPRAWSIMMSILSSLRRE